MTRKSILTINIKSEPVVKPPRLIYIKDRAQPDFCETCGRSSEMLFWSGRKMSCIPCGKDAYAIRRLGMTQGGGMTFKEFQELFDVKIHQLAEKLKGGDPLLFLKLVKQEGDPIAVAFTSRIPADSDLLRKEIASQMVARRDIGRIRNGNRSFKNNGGT